MGLAARGDRSSWALGEVPQVVLTKNAQGVSNKEAPAVTTDSCNSAAKQWPLGVVFHPGPATGACPHLVAHSELEEGPPLSVRVVDANLTVRGSTRDQGAGGMHRGGPSQRADLDRNAQAQGILTHVSCGPRDLLVLQVEDLDIIFEAAESKSRWSHWIDGGAGDRPLQWKPYFSNSQGEKKA